MEERERWRRVKEEGKRGNDEGRVGGEGRIGGGGRMEEREIWRER